MILAAFADEDGMKRAADRLRGAGIPDVESYAAAPFVGEFGSVLPRLMAAAGLLGAAAAFGLQVYATVYDYPLNIGGRPDFMWPAYVIYSFEAGALFAVLTGFLGFLVACRLPRPYDPVDESDSFRQATRDGWFVAVRGNGPDQARAAALLGTLGPRAVETVKGRPQ